MVTLQTDTYFSSSLASWIPAETGLGLSKNQLTGDRIGQHSPRPDFWRVLSTGCSTVVRYVNDQVLTKIARSLAVWYIQLPGCCGALDMS